MMDSSLQLPELNLPQASLSLKQDEQGRTVVFDPLRKKWLVLTPEEWVRQNFTSFLIGQFGYPASMIANEVSLSLNNMQRRCDTVVYNRTGIEPLVIVEYKAPSITVSAKTFDQIARYNMVLKVKCLIVSNGIHHYCCLPDYTNLTYKFVPKIPTYEELTR